MSVVGFGKIGFGKVGFKEVGFGKGWVRESWVWGSWVYKSWLSGVNTSDSTCLLLLANHITHLVRHVLFRNMESVLKLLVSVPNKV